VDRFAGHSLQIFEYDASADQTTHKQKIMVERRSPAAMTWIAINGLHAAKKIMRAKSARTFSIKH